MSTPDTVGEVKSFFSPAASRSIAGCGVSHIREVSQSDGGVEKDYMGLEA